MAALLKSLTLLSFSNHGFFIVVGDTFLVELITMLCRLRACVTSDDKFLLQVRGYYSKVSSVFSHSKYPLLMSDFSPFDK